MGPNKAFGARYRPSYPLENFLSEALLKRITAAEGFGQIFENFCNF